MLVSERLTVHWLTVKAVVGWRHCAACNHKRDTSVVKTRELGLIMHTMIFNKMKEC